MNTQKQRLTIIGGIILALFITLNPGTGLAQVVIGKNGNDVIVNSKSTTIRSSSGKTTIKFDKGSTDYKIEYEGEIEISDDD